MRAYNLQPTFLQYSSFLRKLGAKQVALILMKNSHFHRAPLYTRAAQNFWGLIPQTPNWRLAQNVKVYEVSGPSKDV